MKVELEFKPVTSDPLPTVIMDLDKVFFHYPLIWSIIVSFFSAVIFGIFVLPIIQLGWLQGLLLLGGTFGSFGLILVVAYFLGEYITKDTNVFKVMYRSWKENWCAPVEFTND